jgi:plasmid stability protein
MPEVLVEDLNADTVDQLSQRAQRNGRSIEDEIRAILEAAANSEMATARESAVRMRERLAGRPHSDSVELLAEDRTR